MQTQILGLLLPLMTLFFAVTFAVLWKAGRMKRHVLGFGIAYALFTVGFLVTHFLPAQAFYTFHTTQLFYSLGSIMLLASVCERIGTRLHLGSMAVVYVCSAVFLALAMAFSDDTAPWLVIVNMGYGIMFAMGTTTLLMTRRRGIVDMAIIAVIAFQVADFMIRPTLTLLFERSIPAEQYRDSIYYSIIGLVLGVKGVALAIVLIGASIAEWTNTLRESGARDPLTGLLNRGAFELAMRDMLPRAQAEDRPFSLVVADIDHFKQVNDIWGHQAGDLAITGFGELIQRMVRGCDQAGRVGGEEFCIGVWNCANEPAARLAERIRQALAMLEHSGLNPEIRLTASFGIATLRDGETYEQLFARADEALYLAKSGGRNRVRNAEDRRQDADTPERAHHRVQLKRAFADR
jgi:diguanylate cyclase (GGDEF)-like protein